MQDGPDQKPSAGRWRRARLGGLTLLLTLAVLDGALSLTVLSDGIFLGRSVPPYGAFTHPLQRQWLASLGQTKQGDIGRFDATLGWSWTPDARTPDGTFQIGPLGERISGKRSGRPRAITRILCFGDSFTFGDEVPHDYTFQHILEAQHPEYEVLNFGVSGYGTDQAFLRYQELGSAADAQVITIGILLENIGRNVNRYRPLWNPGTGFCATKPRFILDPESPSGLTLLPQPFASLEDLKTALEQDQVITTIATGEYWLDRPSVPLGRLSSIARLGAAWSAYTQRSPRRLWSAPAEEPFQVSVQLLEAFHRQAIADGARLAPVLIFPARKDLATLIDEGTPYWQALLDELSARSIPFIDLVPPLAARHLECQATPSLGTIYFAGHLSSVGNAVVARELHDWISAQSLREPKGPGR